MNLSYNVENLRLAILLCFVSGYKPRNIRKIYNHTEKENIPSKNLLIT